MSITFWMPQAPVERIVPYSDEPEYKEVRCVPPFVEINMTAGNANAILELIDPESVNREEDPYGTWEQADLARVRSAVIRALNSKIRQGAICKDATEFGTGGCRMVYIGRTEDYVVKRLENFLELTKVAMDHGFSVSFG